MTRRDLPSVSGRRPTRSRLGRALGAATVVLALAATSSCGSSASRPRVSAVSNDSKATYEFVVPKGTNELVLRSQPVSIIPNPFVMKIGEVIRIRNEDSVGYTVGPFYVGANSTMTQVAMATGTFKGMCLLHSGEELQVIITK